MGWHKTIHIFLSQSEGLKCKLKVYLATLPTKAPREAPSLPSSAPGAVGIPGFLNFFLSTGVMTYSGHVSAHHTVPLQGSLSSSLLTACRADVCDSFCSQLRVNAGAKTAAYMVYVEAVRPQAFAVVGTGCQHELIYHHGCSPNWEMSADI